MKQNNSYSVVPAFEDIKTDSYIKPFGKKEFFRVLGKWTKDSKKQKRGLYIPHGYVEYTQVEKYSEFADDPDKTYIWEI